DPEHLSIAPAGGRSRGGSSATGGPRRPRMVVEGDHDLRRRRFPAGDRGPAEKAGNRKQAWTASVDDVAPAQRRARTESEEVLPARGGQGSSDRTGDQAPDRRCVGLTRGLN